MNIAQFVEQISDDFQSTFTVTDANTLVNCLGFKDDFERVEAIIKKYVPNAKVTFEMIQPLKDLDDGQVYGLYAITVTTPIDIN